MSLPSLEAFLEAASTDERLQEQLLAAPDAATLAAIAQAAGFAVREADWLIASGADRGEMGPGGVPEPAQPDPLLAFLHQAQGDPDLLRALADAPDAATVAAIAQAAGYPITAADLWAASGAAPAEIGPPPPVLDSAAAQSEPEEEPLAAGDEVLERFLRQLESDPELQRTLAEAADAAAVAALAQAAGHPLRESDLWRASGLEPQELAEDPAWRLDPEVEPLTAFLHQAQGDPSLQQALAEAADAAAVAAIARAAGYPVSPFDLWAASGAEPEELTLQVVLLEDLGELPN